ncbi:MAG: hypothetical protein WAU86_09490, partial [Oricola sp.]
MTSHQTIHRNLPDAVDMAGATRGALVRRLAVFQVKLFADGLRDLVMSPVSIAAAGVGLLFGGRDPHGPFDRLMEAGHITDNWIDLF